MRPPQTLLAAVRAVVDLGYTRHRARSHTDPVNTPNNMRQARAHALSVLAEAAAANVLPLSREEISKWATWIEGGVEGPADAFMLAALLLDGLPAPAARPLRALLSRMPYCDATCMCSCGHWCAYHMLGGGSCSAQACGCKSLCLQGNADITNAFAEAEQALEGASAAPGGA